MEEALALGRQKGPDGVVQGPGDLVLHMHPMVHGKNSGDWDKPQATACIQRRLAKNLKKKQPRPV